MENAYEIALADLKQDFKGKKLLTPEDIAETIDRSANAQAILRSRGDFPIPTKKMGGKVYISIYDLARYLTSPTPSKKDTSPQGNIVRSSRLPNLSRAILAFGEAIARQEMKLNFMLQLKTLVERQHLESTIPAATSKKKTRGL